MRFLIYFFLCFTVRVGFAKPIYDGTLYIDKPNLSACGFMPTYLVYEHFIFDNKDNRNRSLYDKPNINLIRKQTEIAGDVDFIILDVESWQKSFYGSNIQEINQAKSNYIETIKKFKKISPKKKYGYFETFPIHSLRIANGETGAAEYSKLQSMNNMISVIPSSVDFIFPNGYTFNSNLDNWKRYVDSQIDEARRLAPDKKVLLFLWPQYANYGPVEESLKKKWIEADLWRAQIEYGLENADGLVIWGGWEGKRAKWDNNAIWWEITKDYLTPTVPNGC